MRSNALTPFRVLWKRSVFERRSRITRAELVRRQQRRLAELRRFALERSPFYRKFHSGFENALLEDLPILTKATMMENFDALVTDRGIRLAEAEAHLRNGGSSGPLRDFVVLSTSGSTGLRGVFLFSPAEWVPALANITRPMKWSGLVGGMRPPRLAAIVSAAPWHYSAQVMASLSSRFAPVLRLDAAEPVDSLVRKLNEWQPEVLGGYPSALRQLANEQLAGRLHVKPRGISAAAEVLTDEIRRLIHQTWGARAFDVYGATEYAPIAAECVSGSMHLFEDNAIIEIVDQHGRAVLPGETGDRVLLTVFDRWTQPLIRYEINDRVRAAAGECECGRPFGIIETVEGRVEDVLLFPRRDGAPEPFEAHPNLFHEALENLPVSGWQVIQDDSGLSVLFTGLRDPSIIEPVRESLSRMLRDRGAAPLEIRARVVDALERGATGKAPLILSKIGGKTWRASGG